MRTQTNILAGGILLTSLLLLIAQILHGYPWTSWQLSDMLISYEGGFVRRGLFGQALIFLFKFNLIDSPKDLYILIFSLCLIFYFLALFWVIKGFRRKGYSYSSAIMIALSPSLFLAPIQSNFLIRKDCLLIFVFFISLGLLKEFYWSPLVLNKKIQLRSITFPYLINWFVLNVLSIITILCHESYGVSFLPLLIVCGACIQFKLADIHDNEFKTLFILLLNRAIFFLPSLVSTFLCFLFSGSPMTARLIWNKWIELGVGQPYSAPPAAIDSIGWSSLKAIYKPLSTLNDFSGPIYVPLAWGMIIWTSATFLCFMVSFERNKNGLTPDQGPLSSEIREATIDHFEKYFIIFVSCLLFFSPLFLAGWDFGRWIFMWTSASLAIILWRRVDFIYDVFRLGWRSLPGPAKTISKKILSINHRLVQVTLNKFAALPRSSRVNLYPLPFFCFFVVPGCCFSIGGFVRGNVLGLVFRIGESVIR